MFFFMIMFFSKNKLKNYNNQKYFKNQTLEQKDKETSTKWVTSDVYSL